MEGIGLLSRKRPKWRLKDKLIISGSAFRGREFSTISLGPKEPMLSTIEENKTNGAWNMSHTNDDAVLVLETLYLTASIMSYRRRNME